MLEQRAAKAGVVSESKKGASSGGAARPTEYTTRNASSDSLSRAPMLGLSSDPERDMDEALSEIRAEVEARMRSASASKPLFNKKVK
jgi:lysophospholipid acyltransferase